MSEASAGKAFDDLLGKVERLRQERDEIKEHWAKATNKVDALALESNALALANNGLLRERDELTAHWDKSLDNANLLAEEVVKMVGQRDAERHTSKSRFAALLACVKALKFAGKRLVTPADYAEMWRIATANNDIVERLRK